MEFLYVAQDWETGKIVTFCNFEEMRTFSKEHHYAYEYFSVPIAERFMDADLFLESGEDPSDYD